MFIKPKVESVKEYMLKLRVANANRARTTLRDTEDKADDKLIPKRKRK